MRTERAGAAGHEGGAVRFPMRSGGLSGGRVRALRQGGRHKPSYEETAGTQGQLILRAVATRREHGAQSGRVTAFESLGKVDQSAPALRELQGGNPAQTPDGRLRRVGDRLLLPDGHSTPGGTPYGCGHPDPPERLQEGHGQGGAGGQHAMFGQWVLVQSEQRQYTGDSGVRVAQHLVQRGFQHAGVGVARRELQ